VREDYPRPALQCDFITDSETKTGLLAQKKHARWDPFCPDIFILHSPSPNPREVAEIRSGARVKGEVGATTPWGVALRLVSVYCLLGNGDSLSGDFDRELSCSF
jgi:hypothetical protein